MMCQSITKQRAYLDWEVAALKNTHLGRIIGRLTTNRTPRARAKRVMVAVYLLAGPLIGAMCFVAFLLSGTSIGQAALTSLLIGCCAPVLIAGLYYLFNVRLRDKFAGKVPMKTKDAPGRNG